MTFAAIICEYDPFHAGHAYHISETRARTGAEHVVCIMSGQFTQRGEPAVYDKLIRARQALSNGADMVIELPTLGAVRSAQGFSRAGVKIASAIGADFLSFGAECDDINKLSALARTICDEPEDYRAALRAGLDAGLSFPAARARAVGATGGLLSSPNNILAVEYLCALRRFSSPLSPVVIKREGAGYHERGSFEGYPSATAIREGLRRDPVSIDGFSPVFMEDFSDMAVMSLRRSREYVASLPDAGEGLSDRIYDAARRYGDISEVIDAALSKRYTRTRLSRIAVCSMLGITAEAVARFDEAPVSFVRVLGVREDTPLMSAIGRRVRIVTTPDIEDETLLCDLRTTSVYSIPQRDPRWSDERREYYSPLLRI